MDSSPADKKRASILKEIVESERSYVSDLTVLVRCFVIPLKKYLDELDPSSPLSSSSSSSSSSSASSDESVSARHSFAVKQARDQHNSLFKNVEQILDFNKVFLKDLAAAYESHSASVGSVFSYVSDCFKWYTVYISNFSASSNILKAWTSSSDPSQPLGLRPFIRAIELQEVCHGLTLASFLIMPVQRVPRYKLLLAELLSSTPSSHPDHASISKALAAISSVGAYLNQDVRQHESRNRVVEISAAFDDMSLMAPARLFVREGTLKKVCQGGKKDFHYVLFNDLLIYGSPSLKSVATRAKKAAYTLNRSISLNNSFIVERIPNFPEGFMVVSTEKSFYVDCGSVEECVAWLADFRKLHADLDVADQSRKKNGNEKLLFDSSWRGSNSKNTCHVWALTENPDSGDRTKDAWVLNAAATLKGRGLVRADLPQPRGDDYSPEPGIFKTLTPPSSSDGGGGAEQGGVPGKVGAAALLAGGEKMVRRLSTKFSTNIPSLFSEGAVAMLGVGGGGGQQQRPSFVAGSVIERSGSAPARDEGGQGSASGRPSPHPVVPTPAVARSASGRFQAVAGVGGGTAHVPVAQTPAFEGRPQASYSPGGSDSADSPARRASTGMTIAARASPQPDSATNAGGSGGGVETLDIYVTHNGSGLGLLMQDVKFGEGRTICKVVGFQNSPSSPAQESGVLVNDYVVGINDRPVRSLAEVGAVLQPPFRAGSVVLLKIKRDNRSCLERGTSVNLMSSQTSATSSPASSRPGSARLEQYHGDGTKFQIDGKATVVGNTYTWSGYEGQTVGIKNGGAAVSPPPLAKEAFDFLGMAELDFLNLFGIPKAKFLTLRPDDQEARCKDILK